MLLFLFELFYRNLHTVTKSYRLFRVTACVSHNAYVCFSVPVYVFLLIQFNKNVQVHRLRMW